MEIDKITSEVNSEYNTLEYKLNNKYKPLFQFVENAYQNKNQNKEIELKYKTLFNDLIFDFNSSDYPEDKERCIIYQHSSKNGIKCNVHHNSKIIHLARPRNDRKEIVSNLELKKEAGEYLLFNEFNTFNTNVESRFVLLFGMFYEKNQTEFSPEETIDSCIFSLFPLNDYKEEERDIGISISSCDEKNSKPCKSIIFKSFYIDFE
jgi:hypothetical protein